MKSKSVAVHHKYKNIYEKSNESFIIFTNNFNSPSNTHQFHQIKLKIHFFRFAMPKMFLF